MFLIDKIYWKSSDFFPAELLYAYISTTSAHWPIYFSFLFSSNLKDLKRFHSPLYFLFLGGAVKKYRGKYFAVPVYNDVLGLTAAFPVVRRFPSRSLKTNGWSSADIFVLIGVLSLWVIHHTMYLFSLYTLLLNIVLGLCNQIRSYIRVLSLYRDTLFLYCIGSIQKLDIPYK